MTPTSRADQPESGEVASAPKVVPELDLGAATSGTLDGTGEPRPVPELDLRVAHAELNLESAGPILAPRVRRPVPRRLAAAVGVALAAVLLVVGLVAGGVTPSASAGSHQATASAAASSGNRVQAGVHGYVRLPTATSAPAPAPPSLAMAAPLQSHEVFGYAPYWTLPKSSTFDLADLTTLAYFSVDANANGTLDESGPGWNGYQSQDLVNLVTQAHAAGDRVVLTVTCFNQQTLNQITSDPGAPARLAAALIAAVTAKNLDGVDFDFEGEGSGDRAGLTNLITQVSAALHAADPHWQVTMAVYASAAGDPGGFFDVASLAPAVDAFFVMAYDMNSKTQPSATSPLFGPSFSDATALEEFCKVVPPSKVILGVPFYGYDWPTVDGTPTSAATGPESPLTDAAIAAAAHPTFWDPVTDTPWTAYEVGTQWHRTYFDDPTSLALKAQLANFFHIAGVGIWALGMDSNDPAMMAALLGDAPVVKDTVIVPPGPPGTGFETLASYGGLNNIPLTPIASPPAGGTEQLVGTLSAFGTTDPALTCLLAGPALQVFTDSALPGVLLARATTPTDCASALWTFPQASGGATTTTTTTTTQVPTSSTSTTTSTSTSEPATSTTTSTSTSTSTTTTTTTVPTSTSEPAGTP
jgi:spore germination protein